MAISTLWARLAAFANAADALARLLSTAALSGSITNSSPIFLTRRPAATCDAFADAPRRAPAPPSTARRSLIVSTSSSSVPANSRWISFAAATAAPMIAAAVPALATMSPSATRVMTRSSIRLRAIAQPTAWLSIRNSGLSPGSSCFITSLESRTPIVPRPYWASPPNFLSAFSIASRADTVLSPSNDSAFLLVASSTIHL